jgi:protein-disulfide isomerase-like protein with CxxC motif
MIPISSGEIWYLRLILYKVPVDDYKDAKRFINIAYSTYQLAAIARGLVKDENEAITAFEMVMYTSTPAELRTLFIILTIEGFPTLPIYKNETCLELMVLDYDYNYGESRNRR